MGLLQEIQIRLSKISFLKADSIRVAALGEEELNVFNEDGSEWDTGEGVRLRHENHKILVIRNQWGMKPYQFNYVVFSSALDTTEMEMQTYHGAPKDLDAVILHILYMFASESLKRET